MAVEIAFQGGHMQFDGQVLVELTKRCNYFCRHCYTDASPSARTPEPTTGEVLTLIRSAARLGFNTVTLSGGEPMMRRDIEEIVEECPCGCDIWLFTSGIGLDITRLNRWRDKVTGYSVSLDGGRQKHNALRQSRRSFDDIVGFLKRVAVMGGRLQLQSMVMRGELDHIAAFLELAEAVGCERILFSHVSADGRGSLMVDAHMSLAELDELADVVARLQERTPIRLRTNLLPRDLVPTRFPRPVLHVVPTGEILPWFGAPSRHAIACLADHRWDLESALSGATFPSGAAALFAAAKARAARYPGRSVPVDDLLVAQFKEATTCA